MDKAKQSAEDVKVSGHFDQTSDVASTEQRLRGVRARAVGQRVKSQQAGLFLGKYRAVGLAGVIALTIVALGWFLIRYLQGS